MSDEKDFASSSEGSAVDKFALFCAVVSIACVFGAHGMDKLARNGALPVVAFQRPAGQGAVDYTPTASIPGQASKVQINPCVAPGSNR
jgi:hypothetical protein